MHLNRMTWSLRRPGSPNLGCALPSWDSNRTTRWSSARVSQRCAVRSSLASRLSHECGGAQARRRHLCAARVRHDVGGALWRGVGSESKGPQARKRGGGLGRSLAGAPARGVRDNVCEPRSSTTDPRCATCTLGRLQVDRHVPKDSQGARPLPHWPLDGHSECDLQLAQNLCKFSCDVH